MALLPNHSGSLNGRGQLEEISAEASHALAEVRQISHNLRPYHLDLLGLTKAIEALVKRTCNGAGIASDLVLDDLSNAFPKESEIQIYRIVQECLSNVIKHSQATSFSLFIQRDEASVFVVITDNGIGFSPAHNRTNGQPGGFGLASISERVKILEGQLGIVSAPDRGVRITLKIPCTNSRQVEQANVVVRDEPSATTSES